MPYQTNTTILLAEEENGYGPEASINTLSLALSATNDYLTIWNEAYYPKQSLSLIFQR